MAPHRRSFLHWLSGRVFRLPLTKERAARALDDELSFHLDGRADELIAGGMSAEDARAEAERRFGDLQRIRREVGAVGERSRRRARLADARDAIAQDVRFAVRSLRRRAAFSLTTVVVLSLGIGATTAMYSVIDGVLVQPLAYRNPEQLVTLYTTFPNWKGKPILGEIWDRLKTPYVVYRRLLAEQRVFDDIAGFEVQEASLTLGVEGVRITRGEATANLLSVLGLRVEAGRWFLPGEDGRGAARVAVVSHRLWMSRFGGQPILGRVLEIDEEAFTVVGVLPGDFALEGDVIQSRRTTARADVWLPFGADEELLNPGGNTMELIGRLRPGISLATAEAVAAPLMRNDGYSEVRGARLVSRRDAETGGVRRPLLILFAAVGILLLITCGNVASLFLSECAMREAELRTRAVLGAGRARLTRLLLTESAVIAAMGAALGTLIGWQGLRLMLRLTPTDVPRAEMVHIGWRVWLFTIAVAGIVAVIAGLAPVLTLLRPSRSGTGRVVAGRSRLQTIVIGLQAAMSVVLIAGALLLSRSLANQQRVNAGFVASNTLMMRVDLPPSMTATPGDTRAAYLRVRDALAALPGIRRVTAASMPPLSGRTNSQAIHTAPGAGPSPIVTSERMVVFPNYFEALHVPVLAGRAFTAADVDGAPRVIIVSESFARRVWPGESALGKQLRQTKPMTVVGVVGDVRNKSLDRAPEIAFYLPFGQATARISFLVETRGEPLAFAGAARRATWDAVPGATISEVASMDQLTNIALAPSRYRAALASLFALLALTLTAVGVAGLAARGVAARLPELCVRMALGATHQRVVALVVRGGLGATAAGIAAGLSITPFTSRWLADYLFDVGARDTSSYVATSVLTGVVCIGVTLLATRRLKRADLASVLRRA
jgi:predicted permease